MTTTYRYGIQQRTPPTSAPNGMVRDVSVTDPSAALVQSNQFGIADCAALGLAYGPHVPADYADPTRNYRLIIFWEKVDSANQANNASWNHAYPYLTQDSVNKILAEFDAEVSTSVKPPRHHGHK